MLGSHSPDEPKPNTPTHHHIGFCGAFFAYLCVIPFLFVWFYHAFPTTVLSIVALFALLSFIPCIFNRGDAVVTEPVGPLLAATMLAFTGIVFLGSMYLYWAHAAPLRALVLTREYTGVYPELPAQAFPDAAYVNFAAGTTVNTAKSVSVKSLDAGLTTFCAAPIVNKDSAGRIEFWAVGVDCCGDNDDKFECGDVGNSDAKYGYVMQNPTDMLYDSLGKYIAPPMARRNIFMTALRKAEQTEGLVSTDDALLVVWTRKTKDELIAHEAGMITLCYVINTVISAVMAFILTRINHRFLHLRQIHRTEKFGEYTLKGKGERSPRQQGEDDEEDVSARLSEFLHNMDDNFEAGKLTLTKKVERPPLSKMDTCLMTILLPYVVMMLTVVMTTYGSCMRNGHHMSSTFYIMLSLMIMALVGTPNRVINGMFLLLVSICGILIGHANYNHNMFHYCSIEDRRTYSNVPAEGHGEIYGDAGTFKFSHSAYLSQNYSVGFVYKDTTYCAAPIISRDNDCVHTPSVAMLQDANDAPLKSSWADVDRTSFLQRTSRTQSQLDVDSEGGQRSTQEASASCVRKQPKRVEFWAIGTNCCGARNDFKCDGAKEPGAHSGIIVRKTEADQEEPGGARDQFMNAISQSVSLHDLPMPDEPILIRWGKDPKQLQGEWASRAAGVLLLTAMIGFLSIFAIGAASYLFMVRQRKQELKDEKTIASAEAETGIFTTPRGTHEAGGWSRSTLAV